MNLRIGLTLAFLACFCFDFLPIHSFSSIMSELSKSTRTEHKQIIPSSWSIIMSENFETTWPSTGWSVIEQGLLERKWDDDDYLSHLGGKAVWPARGGAQGLDPTPSSHHYFPRMNTRMIYGPFDLADAQSAKVSFWMWYQTQQGIDYTVLEVSTDGTYFSEISPRFSGDSNWLKHEYSLDNYLGDGSVWIAWKFYSNNTLEYDGPWLDDILLQKQTNGRVTPYGTLYYEDRDLSAMPAPGMTAYLYEDDIDGNDDLLAVETCDSAGVVVFPTMINYDNDDSDPDTHLDLYIVWTADNEHGRVVNFDNTIYGWSSPTHNNIGEGMQEISIFVDTGNIFLHAVWVFEDIYKAWNFVKSNTVGQYDPGFVLAKWQKDERSFGFCNSSCFFISPTEWYIFLDDGYVGSGDVTMHEIGHNYMYVSTGVWWWDPGCWDHHMFTTQDTGCAISEGWANFFLLAVNNDPCFDFLAGPCTGVTDYNYYDLENHSRYDTDPAFAWGDEVEGRVAGSLYDLYDSDYEPIYDSAAFSFNTIWNTMIQLNEYNFSLHWFWHYWRNQGLEQHDAVRAIYQNTINYDNPPILDIPDLVALEGSNVEHWLDLWSYVADSESNNDDLTFQLMSVSNPNCTISVTDHWMSLSLPAGWLGTCDVTVRVDDSIENTTDTFTINVSEITSRIYFPGVLKDYP